MMTDAPPDAAGGSSSGTTDVEPATFWAAVEEHGFVRAVVQFGFYYFLLVLIAAIRAHFANAQSMIDRGPVKSTDEVTREVFTAEPSVAVVGGHERLEKPVGPQSNDGPDYGAILRRLQDRELTEQSTLTQRLHVARGRERTLFGAQLIAAIAAMILALAAVGLVFTGLVPLAAASGAIALLPGSGTVLLRRMWNRERSYRDQLEERRGEAASLVDAIEGP